MSPFALILAEILCGLAGCSGSRHWKPHPVKPKRVPMLQRCLFVYPGQLSFGDFHDSKCWYQRWGHWLQPDCNGRAVPSAVGDVAQNSSKKDAATFFFFLRLLHVEAQTPFLSVDCLTTLLKGKIELSHVFSLTLPWFMHSGVSLGILYSQFQKLMLILEDGKICSAYVELQ